MIEVIIVNWNAGRQITVCINSLIQYGANLIDKIIVIDNDSTDGSDKSVEEMADVKIIRAGKNLGFAKACNLGAKHTTQSEYLLFLNPDAALYKDTLSIALAYMQDLANAKTGICGVQLIDESGCIARSCSRFPSAIRFVAHSSGLDRLFLRFGYIMAEWNHTQTKKVDHVIGAFFLVRRELFVKLHGFDERFFIYFEDVDFSLRACQAGWSSVYLADAQAFHAGGGTSGQVKAKRLFYSLRSRLQYAFKHFSRFGAATVLLTTLMIEPILRTVLALIRLSWTNLKEIWIGYGLLWHWLLK